MNSPIILALDTKDLDTAKSWIESTNESIGVYKICLEFYLKFGAEGLRKFLTIHASGGSAMIKAASEAAPDISITAVTILTSLSDDDLKEIGYSQDSANSATALAKLASENGARSIVCSPFEASKIRNVVGNKVEIITPGVRPEGAELGDQKRVMTPREAMSAGANFLVIGRPITDQSKISLDSMRKTAASILDSLN